MKALKIGILTPTFLPKCSGAEVFHHNLASRLVEAGHRPVVMIPRARVRALREKGWRLPYEIEGISGRGWSMLKKHPRLGFWFMRRECSRVQKMHAFDVWHSVVLHPAGIGFADWQSRSRIPGLVRAVGDDVGGVPGIGLEGHVRRQIREKLPLAQCVVALSDGMAESLVSLGVERSKVRVISNAVDCGRFEGLMEDRGEVRERMGLPREGFVMLCVARNHPQKDFPTLFRAFKKVLEISKERDVHLAVAGRGVKGLRGEVEAAGLGGRVHCFEFAGCAGAEGVPVMPTEELVALYRVADGFVMSSLLEGFSSALIEAMAAGLPVVATSAPGIREVARDGENALVVPCGDAEALAGKMGEIMRNSELRAVLAGGARVTAASYRWEAVTKAYVDLYEELICGV